MCIISTLESKPDDNELSLVFVSTVTENSSANACKCPRRNALSASGLVRMKQIDFMLNEAHFSP